MSQNDPLSVPPVEPVEADTQSAGRRYDPIAPRLPLGRPQEVSELDTPPPNATSTGAVAARDAAAAAVPPALAAILVPAPSVTAAPRRSDDVMTGWVPDIDTDVPAAYADLGTDNTPTPRESRFDEATAAAVEAMAWPPTDDDLDAVEVIDLDAVRGAPTAPARPRPTSSAVAEFKRAAPPQPAAPAPAGDAKREGLAWPPPAEDDDLISVIDISAGTATDGSTALAPSRGVQRRAVARDADRDAVPRSPASESPKPRTWPRVVGVVAAVACAAAAGYYVTVRELVRPASAVIVSSSEPAADESAPGGRADALPREPEGRGAPAGDASTPAEADATVESAAPAEGAPEVTTTIDGLAEPRRLLARGDTSAALQAAMPLAAHPEGLRFIATVLRGASAASDDARATALTRVPGGESLDTFRSARDTQAAAAGAWRAGQDVRALELYRTAVRGYAAVEAPVVASRPSPVGATGRSTDIPSIAPRDPAVARADAPLPPTAPATNGLPPVGDRDPRAATNLAPPAPEARPVAAPRFDEAGVRRTIEAYRSAYDRLDASAASALVPSLDGKALSRAFNSLASQRLDFESCVVDQAGPAAAKATCVGRAASVPKVGSNKPRVDPRRWSFALDRQGDRWVITSAQVAQR